MLNDRKLDTQIKSVFTDDIDNPKSHICANLFSVDLELMLIYFQRFPT